MIAMNFREISTYLEHLSAVYEDLKGPPLEIAICGGTALNFLGFEERPTKDVDVVSPEVWPLPFQEAASITAEKFNLKPDWINRDPVDLLRMGLPKGYFKRCERKQFHSRLVYLITSRKDQIHFKLYASIDRGGYHVEDLKKLNPTEDELFQAACWCMTHDVSQIFRIQMIDFLKKMGWNHASQRLEK